MIDRAMTPERFQQIRNVFESVLELTPEERSRVLRDAQDSDPALASEVADLVSAYARRDEFIEQPVTDLHTYVPLEDSVLDLAGSRVGAYELLREIGRGGMGTVYEAARIDGSFQKRVAVKIVRATLLTASVRERFRLERQIVAGLDHPGIARILDGGATESGQPYFVMEYVAGVRIDEYCRDRRLNIKGRIDLFLRVCNAVQYAHDHLIVHRDIKPGNILVTPEGHVKLLDFGIAKMLSDPAAPEETRAASSRLLTPEYASPEQILGKPITAATDVYLLGLLLYELLAGVHPFSKAGEHPYEVMRAICEEEPAQPSTAANNAKGSRELKGELDNIILMALQKEPRARYSSVEHLRNDIVRHRSGQPVYAQGDKLSYRAGKYLRRNFLAVMAAMLIVLSLSAGIVVSLAQARRAKHEQLVAEQQRVLAQREQQLAEQERRRASAQEVIASQKAAEALFQSGRADIERQRAEKRYGELRSLVTTLLFDLHDGIHDLAGAAPAKKLVLAKAQQYLEALSKETGSDLQLQRELASAYEKTGDLQHDAVGSSGPDGSSLKSYLKALELRKAIAKHAGSDVGAQRDLAFSMSKVGDGHFFSGDTKQALADYEQALNFQQPVLNQNSTAPETRKVIGYIQGRRCAILASAGDAVHAQEACAAGITQLEQALAVLQNDSVVRRSLAASCGTMGRLLYNLNRIPESFRYLRQANHLFELQAVEQPNNIENRRNVAYIQLFLAEALVKQNDHAGGMAAYAEAIASMHTLLSIDPANAKAPNALAYMLTRMAAQMKLDGDTAGAQKASAEAMELLRGVAEKQGSGPLDWNDYAIALARSEVPALRQPAKALELALRASHASKDSNPMILDTLAWAYYLTGDRAAAISTERKALGLISAGNALGQGLRKEIEQNLAAFESGSAK